MDNIIDKIDNKLVQNLENIKTKNKQLIDSENRVKESNNEIQKLRKLYEIEVEKCEQLNDELIKHKFESNIAIEKQVIQQNQQKQQYFTQIERLNNQLNSLKVEVNGLQAIRLKAEHDSTLHYHYYQKDIGFKTNLSSQITQMQTKTQSLAQNIATIDSFQTELKNSLNYAIECNSQMKRLIEQQSNDLMLARNEISLLKQHLIELNKSNNNNNVVNSDHIL